MIITKWELVVGSISKFIVSLVRNCYRSNRTIVRRLSDRKYIKKFSRYPCVEETVNRQTFFFGDQRQVATLV